MAAALVGGAFLSASLQVLFDRIAFREALGFFRGQKNVEKLLKKLNRTLLALKAVVDDAENRQITNPSIKEWLEELKGTTYQAEDLLDEIATWALRSKLEAEEQVANQVASCCFGWRRISVCFSNVFVSHSFESKIERMIDDLEGLFRQKDVLGLKESSRSGSECFHRPPTTSLVSEDVVYGRDGDRDQIIELLLSDDGRGEKVTVIPIVGMGGVGKTTLAQVVYNDGTVQKNFEKKAWVCVSEQYDVFRVTKTILSTVGCFDSNTNDLDQLQVKLRDSLVEKKFLVVLDDVWNKNYADWDFLIRPFKYGAQGSKIIVTTRDEGVASIMRTVPSIHLGKLPDEDCWPLFEKHAFANCDGRIDSRLEAIGKKIVKKCNGLPLAVKTLGGLLRCKLEVKEWSYILNSNMWDLQDDTTLPALRLSYHYLPPHLKRCFAYCSIFPKDYAIDPKMAVLLWMAENLVPAPKSKRTIQEAAQECLNELVARSLLEKREHKIVMHDLVNDLARHLSGEFSCSPDNDKQEGVIEKVRYFSYRPNGGRDDIFKKIKKGKSLRTFLKLDSYPYVEIYLTKEELEDVLVSQKFLRVLCLMGYNSFELPNSFEHLLHLRYLNLSGSKVKCLPDSLTDLFNLQTLDLSHCQNLTELPADMRKLINLHCLDLSFSQIECLPDSLTDLFNLQTMNLSYCRKLTELPSDMRKLINLCYLDIQGTHLKEMPAQMGRLKCLQCLHYFIVGQKCGTQIKELSDLHQLHGSLSIFSLQNVIHSADAFEANLKGKEHLEKLKLNWTGDTSDTQNARDVLDNLQPYTNIKHLIITGYGGTRFSDWLGDHSFRNMVSLRLENCKHCLVLPPLGQLPSLEELDIIGMNAVTTIGQEFYGNGSSIEPFQSLRRLTFKDMAEWEEWGFLWAKEFSCLEELRLRNCPKLKGARQLVGSFNGQMTAMSSLQILKLRNLPNLEKPLLELGKLTNLQKWKILDCPRLSWIAEDSLPVMLKSFRIENSQVLKSLPEASCSDSCIQFWEPSDYSSQLVFTRTPTAVLPTGLTKLEIKWKKLNLPLSSTTIWCHRTSVQTSEFDNSCDFINSIPLGLFTELHSLSIEGMQDLEITSILRRLQNLSSLQSLTIIDWPNLVLLSEQMSILLPSLQELIILRCPKIESFPEGGLPSTLKTLAICDCDKLMANRVSWGLQRLPFLTKLEIGGGSECAPLAAEPQPESFPEEWLLPSTLTELVIRGLPNMESLNGKALQHLTSLTELCLHECRELKALPEEGLPASLRLLTIYFCPLLAARCEDEQGEDWSKVASIPFIQLNFDVIQDLR